MSSLDALATLLAIGGQNQQGTGNSDPTLPLGFGGDSGNINGNGDSGNPSDVITKLLPPPPGASAQTSAQSTISLKQSSTSASQTSSSTQSSQTSSSSASPSASGSGSASSASSPTSSSSLPSASSSSLTGSPATSAALASQTPDASNTLSSLSSSGSSVPTNVSGAADTAPKSFLQNKPLSISVIVVASLLGVIFIILVSTWAVRRRRRDKLHQLAADLSSDSLVRTGSGPGGGGSSFGHGPVETDFEKGAGGGFGGDVLEKMEAVGGGRAEGMSYGGVVGAGAVASRGPSSAQRGPAVNTYGQPAYAAAAASRFTPAQSAQGPYAQGPAPPRNIARVPVPAQNVPYQRTIVAAPNQQYPQVTPYAGPYAQQAQTQTQHAQLAPSDTVSPTRGRESFQYGSHLPNPFENADAILSPPAFTAYDLASSPVIAAQFTVPNSRSQQVQRKSPPPLLTLNTTMSPILAEHQVPREPISAGSLSGAPMELVNEFNPANPPPAYVAESPQELTVNTKLTPKRSSLLDQPSTPRTPSSAKNSSQGHGRKGSMSTILDPGRPPVAPPLPEEFGASTPSLPAQPKVLKVINA